MKKILAIVTVILLTGCAGSPARNMLQGNGPVCSPPACPSVMSFGEGIAYTIGEVGSAGGKTEYVRGYYRSNGTYVKSYHRRK